MFVIPVGSDATLRHQPIVTFILVGCFAIATVGTWIAYPSTILFGIHGLISAEQERKEEANWKAEEELDKTIQAEEETVGHPTARSLAHEIGLDDPERYGLSEAAHASATLQIAEAAKNSWITAAEKSALDAKLAALPILNEVERVASMIGVEGKARPFKTADDMKMSLETLQEGSSLGITDAQADELRGRLKECRVVGDAYPGIYARIHAGGKRPLASDEAHMIDTSIGIAAHDANLESGEPEELRKMLAARTTASVAVAERSVESDDEVPWYLTTVGGWNPLRWLTAMCVHPRWFDALFGLGFTLSFGLVVEGLIGWRRFLPVLGGGIALTYIWSLINGLMLDGILIQSGSAELRAVLAGILVMWVPTNVINYNRWFIVTIGSFEIEIWKIVAFSTAAGVLGAILSGLPLVSGIGGQIIFPACGLAVGYALLRAGWVAGDGWNLPLLLETRQMNPGDRTEMMRLRALEQGGGMAVAAAGTVDQAADLSSDMESSLRESLAAGELDTTFSLWKALRSTAYKPPAELLDLLLKTLYQAKHVDQAAAIAEDLIVLFPERSRDARMILASKALTEKKPGAVRAYLKDIPAAQRTPSAQAQIDRLIAKAAELEAQGVREVEFL